MGKIGLKISVKFYRWYIKHLRKRIRIYKKKKLLLDTWINKDMIDIVISKGKLIKLEGDLYELNAEEDYPEIINPNKEEIENGRNT